MTKHIVLRFLLLSAVFGFMFCSTSCDNDMNKSEITVLQNDEDIKNKAGFYDFGLSYVNAASDEVIFKIQNDGKGTLLLTGTPKIEITGADSAAFIINEVETSTSISSGVSTTFKVVFKPTSTGKKNATISIANNDDNENPFTFTVKGEAYPEYLWTRCPGDVNNFNVSSMEYDSANNAYLVGWFDGTVDFGSEFGVSDIKVANGSNNYFLTKINHDGSYGWTQQMTGGAKYIALDTQDNIYLLGTFADRINFGQEFGVDDSQKAVGNADVFVTKLSSNMNYEWTHIFGNFQNDVCCGIECDSNDNVFFLCQFKGTVSYGTAFGILDIKQARNTKTATILTKIKANGDYGWSRQFGGIQSVVANLLAIDSNDNVYISGGIASLEAIVADFGVTDNSDRKGYFVTKITSEFEYVFTKFIPSGDSQAISSIALDESNNIYITGYFKGSVNFGEDFNTTDVKETPEITITNPIHYTEFETNNFLMKINSDSSYGWTKQFPGYKYDTRSCVAIDNEGSIYFTGRFQNEFDFGMDFGVSDVKSVKYSALDMYLTKIIADTTYKWTIITSTGCSEIMIDQTNSIYLMGMLNNYVDFGEPFGTTDPKTANNDKFYLTKLQG